MDYQDDDDDDMGDRKLIPRFYLTKEQEADLIAAFNLLDYEGVGLVHPDDFRVAIKALGFEPSKDEMKKMVDGVTSNSSERLCYENFRTAIMRKMAKRDSEKDMIKSFLLIDSDNSENINFNNLKKASIELGILLTDEELTEMIDEADRDLDGVVTMKEFFKLMRRCVTLVPP